jgi:hypothetical protein
MLAKDSETPSDKVETAVKQKTAGSLYEVADTQSQAKKDTDASASQLPKDTDLMSQLLKQ